MKNGEWDFRGITNQIMGVLLAGALAGFIAFLQTVAQGFGGCPQPALSVEEVGFLGGTIKAGIAIIQKINTIA